MVECHNKRFVTISEHFTELFDQLLYVKTVTISPPPPDPHTPYKVYVRAIVNKVETGDSVHITAVTDVAPPSEPTITNATCNPSGGGVIGGPNAAVYVQVIRGIMSRVV